MKKQCKQCGKSKPSTEFYKRSSSEDGLHYNCKLCCKVTNNASRIKNKERGVTKTTRKRKAKPGRDYTPQHALRAKEYGVESDATISLHELYKRDRGICRLCKKNVAPKYSSIDHIRPLSKGGSHTWDNVQLTHKKCNLQKGDRL